MKIGSLFVALGFDVDDKKLKSFNEGLGNAQKSMVGLTASAAAGVYALNRFFNDGVQKATALKNFTEQTGYAKEGVLDFFNIASRANTDFTMDDAIGAFTKLGDVIAGIQRGEFPEGAMWQNFGLSVNDTPESAIEKIRAAIPRLMKTVYSGENGKMLLSRDLQSMGLDKAIQAFLLPDEQWNQWKNIAQPTEEQWQAMEKLAMSYRNFNQEFFMFKMQMGQEFAPDFVRFIDWMGKDALPVIKEFFYFYSDLFRGKNPFERMPLKKDNIFEQIVSEVTKANSSLDDFISKVENAFNKLRLLNGADKNSDESYSRFGAKSYDVIPKLMQSDLSRVMNGNLNPALSSDKDLIRMMANNQAAINERMSDASKKFYTQNNTLNISSEASIQDFMSELKNIMNSLSADSTIDNLYGASGNVYSGAGG